MAAKSAAFRSKMLYFFSEDNSPTGSKALKIAHRPLLIT
jgi:hypothetical protein